MPGSVQTVRDDVVRVLEAELGGALVHHPDELLHRAADIRCERVRGVVGALDECGREKVAHL